MSTQNSGASLNGLGEVGLGNELTGGLFDSGSPLRGLREALKAAPGAMGEPELKDLEEDGSPLELGEEELLDPFKRASSLDDDNLPGRAGGGASSLAIPGVDSVTGLATGSNADLPDLVAQPRPLQWEETVVPGDAGTVRLSLTNQGQKAVQGTTHIRVYALSNTDEAAEPILMGERKLSGLRLESGQSRETTVEIAATEQLLPDSYTIYAEIDAKDRVQEANEFNNLVVLDNQRTVAWQFGEVDGRNDVPLTLKDAKGREVRFELRGEGYGEVIGGDDFQQIRLYGTDTTSSLRITPTQSGQETTVGRIVVDGSLKEIKAPQVDLRDGLLIDGSVKVLTFDDLQGQQTVAIGRDDTFTGKAEIQFDRVEDITLTSDTPIRNLKATQWLDKDGEADKISAPTLDLLTIKDESKPGRNVRFDADLMVGPSADLGTVLERAEIAGKATGEWQIYGDVSKSIEVRQTSKEWSANILGSLNRMVVDSKLSGTLAIKRGITGKLG